MNSKNDNSFLWEDPFVLGKKLELLKNYLSTPDIESNCSMFLFLAKHLPAAEFRSAITADTESESPQLRQPQTVKAASRLHREWTEADGHPSFREPLLSVIDSAAERLCSRESPYCRRLAGVAELFSMPDDEIEFLTALYCVGSCSDFRSSFGVSILADRKRAKLEPFARMLWPKQIPHMRLLEIHGRFGRLGLTDEEGDLLTHVILYLIGKENRPLNSVYFRSENEPSLSLDQFVPYREQIDILRELIRCHNTANRPLHLLFHGPTGTGKTELAKALAEDCGRTLFRINQEDDHCPLNERADNHAFRLRAVNACTSIVDPAQSLILIDEADDLLNDGKGFGNETRKALINERMDRTRHVCIWITNHHRNIEESTRRRFDYSIAFESLSRNARLDVWKTCLRKYNLHNRLSSACVRNLARRYRVNAGAIDFAARNAASLPGTSNLPKILEHFLTQNVKLMHDGTAPASPKAQPEYSLSGLNVQGPLSPAECAKMVCQFQRLHPRADAEDQ
ncbi:MAG: AAA family ATPase [bacterium]